MNPLRWTGEGMKTEKHLSSDESPLVEEPQGELAAGAASTMPSLPKSSHVSFVLRRTKDSGDEASPDEGTSPRGPAPAAPDTTVYEERSTSAEKPGEASNPPKTNNEDEGVVAAAAPHQEASDQTQRDTRKENFLPVQQSRGLTEAMALLSATTKDLEGRVNLLLSQHEEDFFAAFRSHMAEVQKHVECLRDCADAQKNLMMRDVKVKTLQNELRWFAEEAIRLDEVCKKLRGDLISWRARTEALREDRDFLEGELKKTKRKLRNAQLQQQCALAKPIQVTPNLSVGPESNDCAEIGSRRSQRGAVSPENADRPKAVPEAVAILKRQVASLTAANRRLQNEAKRNSRSGSSIVEASKALGRRRDLEAFFVECIKDVKKERKLRGAPTASLEDFGRLSLEEFLAFDRRRVLNALLSSDQVLRKLYGLIFPHQGAVE